MVRPIINGYVKDDLVGLGMIVWKGRELYAAGEINREELFDLVSKVRSSSTIRKWLTSILEHRQWACQQ